MKKSPFTNAQIAFVLRLSPDFSLSPGVLRVDDHRVISGGSSDA